MNGQPRFAVVLRVVELLYMVAADVQARVDDVTIALADAARAGEHRPGFPEVVFRVDDPGDRSRFARRLGMPGPESFPPAPVVGRIETYTATYLGVRVQIAGAMPDPLTGAATSWWCPRCGRTYSAAADHECVRDAAVAT